VKSGDVGGALRDDATHRGADGHGRHHVLRSREPLRALLGDAKQDEARPRGFNVGVNPGAVSLVHLELFARGGADRGQPLCAGLALGVRGLLGARLDEGGLGVRELGTVDRGQRRLRGDRGAELGLYLGDPPRYQGRHDHLFICIRLDDAGDAQLCRGRAGGGQSRPDACARRHLGGERHHHVARRGGRRGGGPMLMAFTCCGCGDRACLGSWRRRGAERIADGDADGQDGSAAGKQRPPRQTSVRPDHGSSPSARATAARAS
jgi:hypothetical protein